MKVRCEYCQSEINDFDEKCPKKKEPLVFIKT